MDVERGQLPVQKSYFWQTDSAVARNSWCYTTANDYKPTSEIICDLMDVVSKNGGLLLNIGPKSDGTIPEGDRKILTEMGQWMKVNGEAVYDSKPWHKFGEGPTEVLGGHFSDSVAKVFTSKDMRFTVRGGSLYATVLNWPEDGKVDIVSLREASDTVNRPDFTGIVKNVTVLGFDGKVDWKRDAEALHVDACGMISINPVVIKVELL